jgi:hypothetical protein
MSGGGGATAGSAGKAGGGGAAGSSGSAGAAGSGGGAAPTFEAVGKILQSNCGKSCHKADNGKSHMDLSNSDLPGLYKRLTTPIPSDIQDCKGGMLADPANPSNSILPVIIEKGITGQFMCTEVPRMPNMCGGGGGGAPPCLSKGDIATIQAWVTAGAKGP